jgi:hypothetical protein
MVDRIPTFDLHGRHLVHFGGFAAHIGFYPVPSGIEAFEDELKPFKAGKGTAGSRWIDRCPWISCEGSSSSGPTRTSGKPRRSARVMP